MKATNKPYSEISLDSHPPNVPSVLLPRSTEGTTPSEPASRGLDWNRVDLNKTRNITHPKSAEHVEGLLVDLDVVGGDGGDVRNEVHAALALLLLELEGDAANRALLDPLHEMGGETGDLIAEPLGGNDGHLHQELLVSVKVQGHARVVPLYHLPRRLLHSLCADTAHGCCSVVLNTVCACTCTCTCACVGVYGRGELSRGREREVRVLCCSYMGRIVRCALDKRLGTFDFG